MSSGDGQRESSGEVPEQLALLRETVRRRKPPKAKPRTWRGAALAGELPVARVLVDKGLVHLDRYFDYAVPAAMDEEAQPGVRVRVRFGAGEKEGRREGGRLINGFIVERAARSDYSGALAPIAQVLSPERVLTRPLLRLCRAVADRYAGSLADVVQLAVPPRMARAEKRTSPDAQPPPGPPAPGSWERYVEGPGYLSALAEGGTPRAVWTALPGPQWPEELARAVAAALASGRGALAVLPDGRAAQRVDAALTSLLGSGRHVLLTAESGPEQRYGRWLAVNRGSVRAVVGTRAAMFAPVHDLGLAVLWDDGDAAHSDDHAPQPHAREVLLQRAVTEGAGFLLGGHSCTVEGAQLVESGWARPLEAARETLRRTAPLIRTVGEYDEARDPAARTARLPSLAWNTARDALRRGPVLVQVPRRGYVPRLACERCRAPARCAHCSGPLEALEANGALRCGWCARESPGWHCSQCGGARLRGQVFGARRTAEELGRAFPQVPVRTSGRDHVLETVPGSPAIIVSTPGAEPVAEGPGYAAAVLLDAWALLGRPDLRAGEEALRRWLSAAALVRPGGGGEGSEGEDGSRAGGEDGDGTVLIVAEPTLRPVQALVRWDPAGFAVRELAERAELGFPPVSRMAAVSGRAEAVAGLLAQARLPGDAEVLGPVPVPVIQQGRPRRPGDPPAGEEWVRALVRVPQGSGAALASALKTAHVARLTRREGTPVQIRVDPPDIG
ncbi:primosome assembly protein PriA [Streptomyces abyssalis]|uniref:Probable replication restart protein PriA n=1 Tax=Streptomyces abyssalis TaxID=933944 RepID=A0A1E7JU76_9ACTN|nr:primosomal protein N' [Streptomyces abyssalis]OEU88839.1 primosome assembly protein PriA [Streptomyces abyssalis]OEU93501.1 primosome assembly protein PriA [Streptomyces abyssalis]